MRIGKLAGLTVLIIFYFLAGANHFIHPAGYLKIIPAYIPYPVTMNYISGACEIIFAFMMIFTLSRQLAGWLIVLMLAAFLPVHITMALQAPLKVANIMVTPLWGWLRVAFQPVLMFWAWWNTRNIGLSQKHS